MTTIGYKLETHFGMTHIHFGTFQISFGDDFQNGDQKGALLHSKQTTSRISINQFSNMKIIA